MGWTALALAGGVVAGPFLLPLPELETVPPRRLAGRDDHFASLVGLDVRYRSVGAGANTYLLLHGFGASSRSWDPVMERLSSRGRVVAFDRVGFGLTERPLEWKGQNPYGGTAQVELAFALMEELAIDRAVVIGHSAGAETAVGLAVAHRERISGLVLESPALDRGPGPVVRSLSTTPQGQRIIRFVGRKAADRLEEILRAAYHDPSRISDQTLEGYRESLRADGWDVGLALFTAAQRLGSSRQALRRLRIPILFVSGDDDTWVPTADTTALAAAVTSADLAIVSGCGHVAHEECPDRFVTALTDWLERLDAKHPDAIADLGGSGE
jgi:pimeloyl-ACP methyl ester carboxylesterase